MRILIIGGTRFIGRHVARIAAEEGHDVTLFHRGRTGVDVLASGPNVIRLIGDRNANLAVLAGRRWDATIDMCAFVPRHVTSLADALGDRGGHYSFISSVSVYDAPPSAGFDESSPLCTTDDPTNEVVTGDNYGALKALCELAAIDRFGESSLIVRPTYVVGPDDYSWRFPWWVARLARGGEVLAPGPASDHAQIIDVRDMAAWIVAMAQVGTRGSFHAVSPSSSWTWGEQLELIARTVAPPGTLLTWVEEEWLLGQGVDGEQLPMWTGGDPARLMMAADPAKAFSAGLQPRPLVNTIRDTLAWTKTTAQPAMPGLSPDRERELLARWLGR